MRSIRVALVGLPRMLSEIIRRALAGETDMSLVEDGGAPTGDLGLYSVRHDVDVIIFANGSEAFTPDRIDAMLHVNPRLGLLEMDGPQDRVTLHHLIAAHDEIRQLAQANLAAAVRAGAALRAA